MMLLYAIFLYCAIYLGEVRYFYYHIPHWDTILHALNGFLFSAVGFSLLDIINRNSKFKFKLSPFYLAVVSFCFSMTIGVLWEFFEFGCDLLLGTDMQKDFIIHAIKSVKLNPNGQNVPVVIENITATAINNDNLGIAGYLDIGLFDTMKDLIVNFVGAVIFSVIGFFYIKNRGKGDFAKHFIPVIEEDKERERTE